MKGLFFFRALGLDGGHYWWMSHFSALTAMSSELL